MKPLPIKVFYKNGNDGSKKSKVKFGLFKCPKCQCHFERNWYSQQRSEKGWCTKCSNVLIAKAHIKHAEYGKPLYILWQHIKQSGKNYSSMFKEFNSFKEWAIKNNWHKELRINLICPDKGYFPDNIVWAQTGSFTSEATAKKKKMPNNTSGYIGVWKPKNANWVAEVSYKGTRWVKGGFSSAEAAARARDLEIIKRNWPNRLNFRSC